MNKKISLYHYSVFLTHCLSLIDAAVAQHHFQVTYISLRLAKELKLPKKKLENLACASLAHDIGAIKIHKNLSLMQYEKPSFGHEEISKNILKKFKLFAGFLPLVAEHSALFRLNTKEYLAKKYSIDQQILQLAEFLAIPFFTHRKSLNFKAKTEKEMLNFSHKEAQKVLALQDRLNPNLVKAFARIMAKEDFWFDLLSPDLQWLIKHHITFSEYPVSFNDLEQFSVLVVQLIYYWSTHTAKHAYGVSAVSEALAKELNFNKRQLQIMRIAGMLHDLGKIAVPEEILDFNGPLSEKQFNIMKTHSYFTYKILDHLNTYHEVKTWAAYHHEKLNGKGYPFHLDRYSLPLGSQIMAVADIFTALLEDRPYRKGLPKEKVLDILSAMTEEGAINKDLVQITINNADKFNELRKVNELRI